MIELFHASPNLFEQPTYAQCVANRKNHENGALGLWFSYDPGWLTFGNYVYSFLINPRLKHSTVSISTLAGWSRQSEEFDYVAERNRLLDAGHFYFKLEESDGRCAMGVILNFDAIVDWRLYEPGQVRGQEGSTKARKG